MSRAARLLGLLETLRSRRRPVTAAALAAELGVTPRTLYRDIATLQAQGAPIQGEAGLGYVLRPGLFLPPLMFNAEELDALLLGLSLAALRGGEELGEAADRARRKLEAALPPAGRDRAQGAALLAPTGPTPPHLPAIRAAIRAEHALRLEYTDGKGAASRREVWPVAVGFFLGAEMLAAWCCLRREFRHFRLDRIRACQDTGRRMGRRHRALLAEWRALELDEG